jgi:hypothetical protein
MVNSKEQARQLIKDAQLKIMDLSVFEEKVDLISTLTDLEWSLRELEVEQEDSIDEEMRMGIESPWSE